MATLAIDFGTTTTVAAVRVDDASMPSGRRARSPGVHLVTTEGSPLMPSAIYLADNGRLLVGRDAERQARLDPSRFEPNPKRRIDDGELLLGPTALALAEVIGAVLRRALDESLRIIGRMPAQVVLTHPARWSTRRRQTLLDAAGRAGLPQPVLIPEPVAAAHHFTDRGDRHFAPGSGVAVYDLGGGTFDAAVLRRTPHGWQVVAESGLPDLGGVDFDEALLRLIGRRVGAGDPERWASILAPPDADFRRARRALVTDVREGKESLSRWTETQVPMPTPFDDVTVTRSEFEGAVRDRVRSTVDLLAAQLAAAGGPAGWVSGVYLVGGSSRIPLITRLITETLGATPIALDQPETVVAAGALLAAGSPARGAPPRAAPPRPVPPGRPSAPTPAVRPPATPGQPGAPRPPARSSSRPAVPAPPDRPAGVPPTTGSHPAQPPARPGGSSSHGAGPPRPPPPAPLDEGWWTTGKIIGVAALVVIVVLGIIFGIILGTAGSRSQGPSPAASAAATSGAASPPGSHQAARTVGRGPAPPATYRKNFPDPAVWDYVRPASARFRSCEKYDPKTSSTTCRLPGGLSAEIGSGTRRTATLPLSSEMVGTGARTWREARWASGTGQGRLRTWRYDGKATKPALYWDRNGVVFGLLTPSGKRPPSSAVAENAAWTTYFKR